MTEDSDWSEQDLMDARAEIERLQAELDTAEIAKVKLLAEVDQLRTENRQLRAMIEKIEPLTTLGLKVAKVMPRPPEQ